MKPSAAPPRRSRFSKGWKIALAGLLAAAAGWAWLRFRPPAGPPRWAAPVAAVSGARALAAVREFLALEPWSAGTERTAEWLRGRLAALGLEVEVRAFTRGTPDGPAVFRNVLARRPGRGPGVVLLGAHYDVKTGIPGFQGANDPGAGVGALLELACAVAAGPEPPCEIAFAFFDGEECRHAYGANDGLHGSRQLAGEWVAAGRARDVRAVIVLDMIGDRDFGVQLPRNGDPALIARVFDAAREEGARDRFQLGAGLVGDDHAPFHEAGMPAVDLIDFDYGSAPGINDYWHTARDTLDKLSADSLGLAARVALRVAAGVCQDGFP